MKNIYLAKKIYYILRVTLRQYIETNLLFMSAV